MMVLGGAWSNLNPTIKKLTDCGSKLVILDACDNFKTKPSKNIKVINKIISNKKGKAMFYETSPPDSSSLFEPNEFYFESIESINHVKLNKKYEVNTVTLKDLGNFKPNYLCMDLQGGELKALEGTGRDFFNNLDIITTECCFVPLYKDQPTFLEYLTYFESKGYVLIDFGTIRKSKHKDFIYKTNAGSMDLYTDLTFYKVDVKVEKYLKTILCFLIEKRYFEFYLIHNSIKEYLDKEFLYCFEVFFNKLKRVND